MKLNTITKAGIINIFIAVILGVIGFTLVIIASSSQGQIMEKYNFKDENEAMNNKLSMSNYDQNKWDDAQFQLTIGAFCVVIGGFLFFFIGIPVTIVGIVKRSKKQGKKVNDLENQVRSLKKSVEYEKRLRKIRDMFDDGEITKKVYDEKKKEIENELK